MKRAYHRIVNADGTAEEGPVLVETDASGRLVGWRRLRREESNTEWVGGDFRMEDDVPGRDGRQASSGRQI